MYCEKCGIELSKKDKFCAKCGTKVSYQKPKKRKTWLWILGWLFIFPLPLTLFLQKKGNMNKFGKYAALAAAWLFYLLIVWPTDSTEPLDSQVLDTISTTSAEEIAEHPFEERELAVLNEKESLDKFSAEETRVFQSEEMLQPEFSEKSTENSEEESELVFEEKTEVSFESKVNSETGFIIFYIKTNLPEGSNLIVQASNADGYEEANTVTISSEGSAITKEFFSGADMPDGDYVISVLSENGEAYASIKQSFTNKERATLKKAEEEAKAKELAATEAAKAEAERKAAVEAAKVEAERKAAEAKPAFTFKDCSGVKYPSIDMNVRNKPNTSGDKVGSLLKNQEVVVTGQCVETGWYRIKFGEGEAYAHNAYLLDEKTVDKQIIDSDVGTTRADNASSSSGGNASVTVPDIAEIGADMVWIPINGGKKYHRKSSCSNMIDPMQVTREQAEANGFTPCGRCNP